MHIYWTQIIKIIEETPEVKTFLLDCPIDFTWKEGAHTHLALKGFNTGDKPNRNLVRHMSISSLPTENVISITTRMKELCSEYKAILKTLEAGDEIALFKTHSNIPLKRINKNIYLLSSGVGLATFRPIVLDYFNRLDGVKHMHSLNIDSTNHFLFTDIFTSNPYKKFTAQFVNNRADYYKEAKELALDNDGLFYIVGSDNFLVQNIELLREQGIQPEQIMLDKHEHQLDEFFQIN